MQLGPTLHDWHHSNGFGQVGARFARGVFASLRELFRKSPAPETRLEQHERRADRAKSPRLPSPAQAQQVPPLLCSLRIRGRFGNETTQPLPPDNPKQVLQDR